MATTSRPSIQHAMLRQLVLFPELSGGNTLPLDQLRAATETKQTEEGEMQTYWPELQKLLETGQPLLLGREELKKLGLSVETSEKEDPVTLYEDPYLLWLTDGDPF